MIKDIQSFLHFGSFTTKALNKKGIIVFTPFTYQGECCGKISEARSAGAKKALVVMASGLGKTVTAAFDVQRWFAENGPGRFLYLCHQNEILHQASTTFGAVLGSGHRTGFFHGTEKSIHGATCIFASLRTVLKHGRDAFHPDSFDYIVVDESHHTPAPSYLEAIRYFTPKFLLGLTATPDRRDGLNIRSVFGDEVYHLPLEVALARGLLTPVDYRLLTDDISLDTLEGQGRVTVDDINDQAFLLKCDEEVASIISRHASEILEPRTIVFAGSIARAEQISKVLPESVTIHSRVPQKERSIRLELFRAGLIPTVVTVDCFNEGVDIPQANLIVFLRSTASPTIFFQQLGRGLRRFEGKDKVRVLDFVGNCERISMLKELSYAVKRRQRATSLDSLKSKQEALVTSIQSEVLGVTFDAKAEAVLSLVKKARPDRIADHEDLIGEYSEKNLFAASHISAKTWREVWWKCSVCGHEYKLSPALRLSGRGCQACADRVTEDNNLFVLLPRFAKEFSVKNPLPAWRVKATSSELFWWTCKTCGFEWRGRLRGRVHRGDGCPACAGQIERYKDNLALLEPQLAEEYSDVNMLSPEHVRLTSRSLRWWVCRDCGKSWQTSIEARVRFKLRCANCAPKIPTGLEREKSSGVIKNVIVNHPHLVEEYASRNRIPVETALTKAEDPLWWLCFDCGRYWQASVRQRLEGARCSTCHPATVAEIK